MGKFEFSFLNPPEDSPKDMARKERIHNKLEELQNEKNRLFSEAGIKEKEADVEQTPERIPTPEEIFSVIKSLTEKETTEIRRLEDEDGVYLLEVTVQGDTENEVEEYAYMRKGRRAEGGSPS
jgi:predicted nuclease with TOPRIM domain